MKFLNVVFAVALSAMTLTHSAPSKAAVGVILVNPAVVVGGLKMMAVGAVLGAGGGITMNNDEHYSDDRGIIAAIAGTSFITGVAAAVLGIIVLDGEQKLQFSDLDIESAKKIGLNRVEREAYNSEVDQLNYLMVEVTESLSEVKNPSMEDSRNAWELVKNMVSPDTLSAIAKITAKTK